MPEVRKIKNTDLEVMHGDITLLDVDAFVFYAREDLKLGSGFGTMVSLRGGPSVQEELGKIGKARMTEAVVTSAGNLKAKHIIHAVGPKFQEEELEKKLKETIVNALKKADEKGLKKVAFPVMGAGFYGVPLENSAAITLKSIAEYLQGKTQIESIIVCGLDQREFKPLHAKLAAL